MVAEAVSQMVDYLKNRSNLDRIGLARHEEEQDRPKKSLMRILDENSGELEKLLRSMPQLYGLLADVRRGLRTRWNAWDVYDVNTNSVPTTGNGTRFDCMSINGGVPWDSFTIDSVGGAGTTMEVMVNDRGRWVPVNAGDVFDNGEIWSIMVRVTTAGAGTGRLTFTSYIPGVGGLRGIP